MNPKSQQSKPDPLPTVPQGYGGELSAAEPKKAEIPSELLADQRIWREEAAFSTIVRVSSFYDYWVRTIDIIFGLCGVLVILLMLPILGLFIYLDSPGPLFYSQDRLGYQKRLFRLYKFRSMTVEAGRTGHQVWATAHDPRVTRVGQFLRATHLDELPQAWNILRGEMSLIGPRPEMPAFAEKFEQIIPFYNRRFSVKPGLTGWTQVNHNYGDTIDDERIKLRYDLEYIDHRSYLLDLQIIVRTVGEVLFRHGR